CAGPESQAHSLQGARGQAGTAPSHPAENSPHHPMASPAPSPQGTLSPDEQGTAGPEAEAVALPSLMRHANMATETEPGQAAVAGTSAQGRSRNLSEPGCVRDCSTGGSRRSLKRRAPSPQDSPQPCKRSPHRQHRAQAQAALTQANGLCPICRDAPRDVAYVMPCCHQFCLGCILRGLDLKGECPVCRGPVEIVQFPVRGENGYTECFPCTLDSCKAPEARRAQLPVTRPKTAPITPWHPLHLLHRGHCPHMSRALQGQRQRQWVASCLRSGQNFSKQKIISSIPCGPGCAWSCRQYVGPAGGRHVMWRPASCTPCASVARLQRPWFRCCNLALGNVQHFWSTASSRSLWTVAARRPRGCCAPVLCGRTTTALRLAPAPPDPAPAPFWWCTARGATNPQPQPAVSQRLVAATARLPHIQGRPRGCCAPVLCGRTTTALQLAPAPPDPAPAPFCAPLLPAASGTAQLGGPCAPSRGGPPVARTLPSPARGCVAGGTSAPILPDASGTAQLGGP
ncbi:unnamed protein product, partial [Bubo scandiacus]